MCQPLPPGDLGFDTRVAAFKTTSAPPRLRRADGRWNCTFRLTTVTVVGHGDTPAAAWADMNRAIRSWKLK